MSCPCELIEPCQERCSCATPASSNGCLRCCRYGSLEQRTEAAKRIATSIDEHASLRERLKFHNEKCFAITHAYIEQLEHIQAELENEEHDMGWERYILTCDGKPGCKRFIVGELATLGNGHFRHPSIGDTDLRNFGWRCFQHRKEDTK